MRAIKTYFRGGTDHSPPRYIATDMDGNRKVTEIDHALGSEENHKAAALALCEKMNWPKTIIGGSLHNDWVWVIHECQKHPLPIDPNVPDGVL